MRHEQFKMAKALNSLLKQRSCCPDFVSGQQLAADYAYLKQPVAIVHNILGKYLPAVPITDA